MQGSSIPPLKHVDYCILNEIEAGKTTGFASASPMGVWILWRCAMLRVRCCNKVCAKQWSSTSRKVASLARATAKTSGNPRLKLPASYIAGTAGAGDAFCAGVLFGLHEEWDLKRCLVTGVCLAAASLSDATCTNGVKSLATSA